MAEKRIEVELDVKMNTDEAAKKVLDLESQIQALQKVAEEKVTAGVDVKGDLNNLKLLRSEYLQTVREMNKGDAKLPPEVAESYKRMIPVLNDIQEAYKSFASEGVSTGNATKGIDELHEKLSRIQNSLLDEMENPTGSTLFNGMSRDIGKVEEAYKKMRDDIANSPELYSEQELASVDKLRQHIENTYGTYERFKQSTGKASTAGVDATTNAVKKASQAETEAVKKTEQQANQVANLYSETDEKIKSLSSTVADLSKRSKEVFKSGDPTAYRQLAEQLKQAKQNAEELRAAIASIKEGNENYDLSGMTEELEKAEQEIERLSSKAGESLHKNVTVSADKIKSVLTGIGEVFGDSLKASFNLGKKAATTYFSFLKQGFSSVANYISGKFKGIFESPFKGSNTLIRQLIPVAGLAGLVKLGKESIKLSSDLFEIQNVVNNVFPESLEDINNFCETSVEKFGLTELAAKQMAGVFGGLLNASGIVGQAKTEMSKNLVALTGDLASFYNMSEQDVYKKLQSGLTGNVQAMRSFGVSMTVANLEAYALERGITKSYKSMTQAEKTTLRYNYMLNSLSVAQGDFSRTTGSWANQTRLLSNNFKQLASTIGGVLVKALYPAVVMLNSIVKAANAAANALARLFGFDAQSLSDMFGGSGGLQMPDTSGYEDGMEGIADATEDATSAQKEYNEELQGFDRLNNIDANESSGKGNDDLLGGVDGLDFDSYYEGVLTGEEATSKLEDFVNEMLDLLTDHRWNDAGRLAGKAISDLVDIIYNKIVLNKQAIRSGIKDFNGALSEFLDGTLTEFEDGRAAYKAGATLGTLASFITQFVDTFYTEFSDKDGFRRVGSQIADFFNGLGDEIDWAQLGRTFTTGFRISMDMLSGFLDTFDFEALGSHTKELLLGAIDRAFGDGGAEEIGHNISGVVKGGIEWFTSTFGDGQVVGEFSSGLVKIINTAIHDITPDDFGDALSTVFTNIGVLFNNLADIDFSTLGENLGEGLNQAVDNGSVRSAAEGLSKLFLKMIGGAISFIKTVDWIDLALQIWQGIKDGMEDNEEAIDLIKNALIAVFTVKLVSRIGGVAFDILSKAIVQNIASGMAGGESVSLFQGGLTSLFSAGGVIIGSLILAWGIYKLITGEIDRAKEHVKDAIDETNAMKSDNVNLGSYTGFDNDSILDNIRDAEGYIIGLTKRHEELNKVVDEYNPFSIGEQQAMRDYREELIQTYERIERINGANEYTTQILDVLNNKWKTAPKAVEEALKIETEMLVQSKVNISELYDDMFTEVTKNEFGLVDLIVTSNGKVYDATTQQFKGMRDEMPGLAFETIDAYCLAAVGTDALNAIADASGVDANAFYKQMQAELTGDEAKSTITDSVNELITDGAENAQGTAETKGTELGGTLTDSQSEEIRSSESKDKVTQSLDELIGESTENTLQVAEQGGQALGESISSGASDELDNNGTGIVTEAVKSVVSKAIEEGQTKASESSSIGENIVSGVESGVESKKEGLLGTVRGLASSIMDAFKVKLDINSPSKEFENISEWIPEGVVKGIKNTQDKAVRQTSELANKMLEGFDLSEVNDLEYSNIIDSEKFSKFFSSMYSDVDLFVNDVNSRLSDIGLSDIDIGKLQAGVVVSPKTEAQVSRAQYDMSGSAEMLYNMASLSRLLQSQPGTQQNGKMEVSVYLDASTRLGQFVIDTVNGQVIKTGGF